MRKVYYEPRKWTTTYEMITLDDSVTPVLRYSPCSECNKCLAGKEFFSRNDSLICWDCCEKVHGLKCVVCQKSITGTGTMTFIYYYNRTWHRECFKCSACGKSLEGRCSLEEDGCIHCTECGACVKFETR